MTHTIDFSLDLKGSRIKSVPFRTLDTLEELPEGPGLYVLMGSKPGETPRPLAFGYLATNLARHLAHQPEFAAALREGFDFAAIADPLPGSDPAHLADRLGRIHKAPINALRSALRDIDSAKLTQDSAPISHLPAE